MTRQPGFHERGKVLLEQLVPEDQLLELSSRHISTALQTR